jgi:hypothetical protein
MRVPAQRTVMPSAAVVRIDGRRIVVRDQAAREPDV